MAKKVSKPNKPYTLVPCKRKHDHRILSLDPGSKNMGIACLGTKNGRVDVIANSIMMHPITSMTNDHMALRKAFVAELRMWIKLYKPHAIVMERFQARGGKGPLIELVTTMNTLISVLATLGGMPFKFLMPATWKNSFHRRFVGVALNDLYKDCRTTPHQFDAVLIGCYGLELALRQEFVYTPDSIIEMTETSSRLDLRRPKK